MKNDWWDGRFVPPPEPRPGMHARLRPWAGMLVVGLMLGSALVGAHGL
jgi:hypothetical protein